jgi:hypothetical protein
VTAYPASRAGRARPGILVAASGSQAGGRSKGHQAAGADLDDAAPSHAEFAEVEISWGLSDNHWDDKKIHT